MQLEIKNLGTFLLKPSSQNKKVKVKWLSEDNFAVSYPSDITKEALAKMLESMQQGILRAQKKYLSAKKDERLHDFDIEPVTLSFSVKIDKNDLSKNYFTFAKGVLLLSFDKNCNILENKNRKLIENIFEKVCNKEAKKYFSRETERLAKLHGFKYYSVKISKAKTRWGSCSLTGNINFSLFAMRLPQHLAEYLILHELCHTVQFNHSDKFWALMDKVTNNKAKELSKELDENYHTAWSGHSIR